MCGAKRSACKAGGKSEREMRVTRYGMSKAVGSAGVLVERREQVGAEMGERAMSSRAGGGGRCRRAIGSE